MEYFIIEYDRRLPQQGAIQWPERMLRGYEQTADEEMVYVKQGEVFTSPCIVNHYPIQLYVEELSRIMLKMESDLHHKRIVVMNLEQQNQTFYEWIELPQVSWMAPQAVQVEAGQVKGIDLGHQGLSESSIWCVPYYRSYLTIVGLEVAEKLLKAGIYGLILRPIQITGGELDGDYRYGTR
ncbi:hypothetical protein [Paenibacillus tundrae]